VSNPLPPHPGAAGRHVVSTTLAAMLEVFEAELSREDAERGDLAEPDRVRTYVAGDLPQDARVRDTA
jgi:hypothetical protein